MHLRQPALAEHTLHELLVGMTRPVSGSQIKRAG
jgi:hypothetical protein